jgi:hypothetical protein
MRNKKKTEKMAQTPTKKKRNLYSTNNDPERPPSAGSTQILEEFEACINKPNIQTEDVSSVITPARSLKYWSLNSHHFLNFSCVNTWKFQDLSMDVRRHLRALKEFSVLPL